jgi:hypothetical protein
MQKIIFIENKKRFSAGELTEGEESLFLVDFFRLQPASPTDPTIGIPTVHTKEI